MRAIGLCETSIHILLHLNLFLAIVRTDFINRGLGGTKLKLLSWAGWFRTRLPPRRNALAVTLRASDAKQDVLELVSETLEKFWASSLTSEILPISLSSPLSDFDSFG